MILNPRSGKGAGSHQGVALEAELRRKGIPFRLAKTEYPGHAGQLAKEGLKQGYRPVVVAGGDGTISEAAAALVESPVAALGIVPLGTGNDLARNLRLPIGSLAEAVDVIVQGKERRIDVGSDQGELFVSVLGLGFPAIVAEAANRVRVLRGRAAFCWGVYSSLRAMKPFGVDLRLDGEIQQMDVTSVLIQNTALTGGGLMTAPGAKLDDGLLDVLVVGRIGKLSLMVNFPKVYRGRHLSHPSFRAYRCREVRVDCPFPVPKMGDGDQRGYSPIEVSVKPAALRVLIPAESRV